MWYVYSDWAGNETDRRSTTGYLFEMFFTEAEYIALFEELRKHYG